MDGLTWRSASACRKFHRHHVVPRKNPEERLMRLNEYQWSHNPRGLHNSGAPKPADTNRYIQLKCGWAKLVSVDREHMQAIPVLLGNNCTPIVRVYRPHFGASAATEDMTKAWREYFAAGVR